MVSGQAMEGCKDCAYAINLASSRRNFTVDDLPNRDILLPYRVYTISFVTDGETWNRLRTGFFDSRDSANAVRHRLIADYPGAWVTAVSESEKIGASKTAIEVNDPQTVAVMESSSESARADAIPPAMFDRKNASPDLATSPPPQKLALAGAEYGSKNAYYYTGLLVPFPGSDLGNGFVQRYWADWLYYEYEDWNHTIKAKAPGLSIAVGYGKATETGNWTIYVGPVWRHTNLTPDEPDSDVRGTQWGVNGSLEGERRIGENWRANGIASFTTGSSSYWTRGRLIRRLESGPGMGVELVFHGNDDYSAWQSGLVLVDLHPVSHTSLGLKGGIRKSSGEDVGAYVGIELGRTF
jgi:hypothetical protein